MTLKGPQNDRLNLSFVKDFFVVAKKWPEMVIKWPFMSHKFSFVFLTKLQKTKSKPEAKKEVFDQIKLLKNRVGPLKMTVRSSVL